MNSFLKFFVLALCLCALTGCGDSDISNVKNGILDFDRSTTIGNVLDSYKYFSSKKWSTLQDQQKRTIVQFEAEVDRAAVIHAAKNTYIISQSSAISAEKHVRKCLEIQECPLHSARTFFIMQFTIMPDDRFQISYIGTKMENGKSVRLSLGDCLSDLYAGNLFIGMGMTMGFGAQEAYRAYEWIKANQIDVYE